MHTYHYFSKAVIDENSIYYLFQELFLVLKKSIYMFVFS